MRELKAGVIGLGVGGHHLRAYASHPLCHPVAACDFSEQKLAEASDIFPGLRTTAKADEVIGADDIDVISVASYDDHHVEQVLDSLASGKHVMVEKPMCLSPDGAAQIRQAVKESEGLRLSSNLPLRTCPRFQHVREALQSGEMGKVYHLEADYYWGRIEKLVSGWRPEMDYYSIVLGAAVHMIDLVAWLVGELPVSVQGVGSKVATKSTALKYDDFACLLFEFSDGVTAKIAAHGGCKHPHFHSLSVFGTDMTFQQTMAGAYWIRSSDPGSLGEIDEKEYPAKELRGQIISSFVDAILDSSKKPIVNEKSVFDVMDCCFAAERAIRESGRVDISYNWA